MADNNPIKLDKKDKLLMQELEKNSRASLNEIGKRIGLSGEVVDYRIRRLRNSGIISRLYAEPDTQKLGLTTYRLYLKMENLGDAAEQEFLDYLLSNPGVQWYAEFEGEWDYTVRYALAGQKDFKRELDSLISKFGKHIKAKDVVISAYQAYLPATYLTGAERAVRRLDMDFDGKTVRLDEADRKMLSCLSEDSRMTSVEMGKRAKLSPDAVQYRLKKLVSEGAIAFFGAWFDRRKLGYEYYKVLLWLQFANEGDEKRLVRYCEHHPNVVFVNRVLGGWDLEIDMDAKNSAEIHEIVKGLEARFSPMIRDHATLVMLKDEVRNPFRK